jgi:hypothetical protein
MRVHHYVSYHTMEEAKFAQQWARQFLGAEWDRIQGASAPHGDLYLGGTYWYVFSTRESLSFEQMCAFVHAAPSCGHSLNLTWMYW